MAEKYVCIHGHFYQPPRENAWLEAVEVQDSAHPYHDWNDRVCAECYAANAYSRILDNQGKIAEIVNNYETISFNFGPTLLSWMEDNAPKVYQAIVRADRKSAQRFSGHGSAMAQAYNHMILPLANRRDKYTQVLWGIRDFRSRFERDPEGMWLPETAVDLETLEIMAKLGIAYTVLSPYQAGKVRKIGEKDWRDVRGGIVDPKRPYIQKFEAGGQIAIFFYDGPISQAVAFEGLLKNGEKFADRLVQGFVDRQGEQLVHIATDGESYGHHSAFGDMALAYALKHIEDEGLAILTNYGEHLEKFPPDHEVKILENTSWSCLHGVERWRNDCGCGGVEGKNQKWRRPLREALDRLRDDIALLYEKELGQWFSDPWEARDEYIDVILDRSPENLETFLRRHAAEPTEPAVRVRILKLLEIQRHAMLMYTSCGWFFEELSRIETVQIIQYAGRILQLCTDIFSEDLETPFLEKMEEAKSNSQWIGDGKRIYQDAIKPAMADLKSVASHFAISSVFEAYPEKSTIFCYHVHCYDCQKAEAGVARLSVGRLEITSEITRESATYQFGVLYVGDHNLSCGIGDNRSDRNFEQLGRDVSDLFDRAQFTEILGIFDRYFEDSTYSLNSLHRDEQRKIINLILESKVQDALAVYGRLYRQNLPLMRFLTGSATPCPLALYNAGSLALNGELKGQFGREELDRERIEELLKEADLAAISLDADTLEYTIRKNLEAKAEKFAENTEDLELLKRVRDNVDLLEKLPFEVNLRTFQNIFDEVADRMYHEYRQKKQNGDQAAVEWNDVFGSICEIINLRTSQGEK